MTPLRPPTESEALVGQQKLAMEKLIEIVQANDLNDYRILANELLEEHNAVDLVAAAIKSMTKEPDDTPVTISEERPLPMRKERSSGGRGRSGDRGGRRDFGGRRDGGRGRREGGRREGASAGASRDGGSRRDGGRRDAGSRRRRKED